MTFKSLILGTNLNESVDTDLVKKIEKIHKDQRKAFDNKDFDKFKKLSTDYIMVVADEVAEANEETIEEITKLTKKYEKDMKLFLSNLPIKEESREDELAQAKLIQKYADKLEKLAKAEKDKKKRSFFNMIVNALSL